jgi:DNA-directed RNA polymerase specialized sigma24 family protein
LKKVTNTGVQDVQDGVQDVQDVIDWLERLKMLDELINAKLRERQQVMDMATKITPGMDGMPHGGGVSDKVGNAVSRLVDLAAEIDELVDKFIGQKVDVVNALEKLPAKEFGVLHRHYVQYMTLAEIAKDMNYSEMHIWRIKTNGLKLLKGVVECYTIPVV